jgi:glucose/arabinose dehydrogenase
MKINIIPYCLFLSGLLLLACNNPGNETSDHQADQPAASLKAQFITDDIPNPVAMAVTPDGRLFVCQKDGKIWVIKNNKVLEEPLLDLTSKMIEVNKGYDERGLLGIELSPQFSQNGKFYVYYSAPTSAAGMNNKNILAEYKISSGNPDRADPNSERKLMEIQEPESNHEGGCLAFGSDGYLYIGVGDGGGGGDHHGPIGNGQNLNTWLGKILRIDVNGDPYQIPGDNPFVGRQNVKPEIWAYGLRNPWRFSFDKTSHQLFAGDVGQNKYEEVDIIKKGGNYGWRIMEGLHVYNMPDHADTSGLVPPINEYPHSIGISVIGGYVYRGKAIPALEGKYIFGDYNGKFFSLSQNSDGSWERQSLNIEMNNDGNFQLFSFGEDNDGELYILGQTGNNKGVIYKLVSS